MTNPVKTLQQTLQTQLGAALFGLEEIIQYLCIALIARGHVLLESVPGLGKTLLSKMLAEQLGGTFKRVQCTSDLMPSDITGLHIFNTLKHDFEFIEGPIFSNVLLVDEINRTGPKTQSALLQAMEERVVTIDNNTYTLPENFFVIAAQNPKDFEGVYPLPESQLDRFLMKLNLSYPSKAAERKILHTYSLATSHQPKTTQPTLSPTIIQQAQEAIKTITISDLIIDYAIGLCSTTREHREISLGISTRGALALLRSATVKAALEERDFVSPDDIKKVAQVTLAHRLILTPEAQMNGKTGENIIEEITRKVEIPR